VSADPEQRFSHIAASFSHSVCSTGVLTAHYASLPLTRCAGYISYPPRKLRVSLFNYLVFDNCYCSWSEAWVNVLAIPDRNTLTITQTSNLVRSLHQGKRQATACWLSTQRQSWILRYSAHDSGSQSFISEKIHALRR
jgi:hypothetical protein